MSAIEVRALTRCFGTFVAVDRVSFVVEQGEIFGYLGANGAGKSTTIRMLCGLLAPSEGSAVVGGFDVASDPERVKRAIGYMSQRFSLYPDLPVLHNLEFFGGAYGLGGRQLGRRIDELLALVDLSMHRMTRARDLPGGMRQRLALASALLHDPPIVFLDEPTAGVDPAARRVFWRLIRDLSHKGTTVFVTTHSMDEAEFCERIGLMVDGHLVALDTPSSLKRTHIREPMVRVDAPGIDRALAVLTSEPGVIDAQVFGSSIHLRVDDIQRIPAIDALLRRLGHNAVIRDIEPTLEDVFLAVARTS